MILCSAICVPRFPFDKSQNIPLGQSGVFHVPDLLVASPLRDVQP